MQKELLSAYMDGEEVSAELTEQLCQDKDLQESLKDLDKDFNLIMGQKYQIFNHEQHCVLKGIITYYSHFYEDK